MNIKTILLFLIVTVSTVLFNSAFSLNIPLVGEFFEALFFIAPGLAGLSLMFFILIEPIGLAFLSTDTEKEDIH